MASACCGRVPEGYASSLGMEQFFVNPMQPNQLYKLTPVVMKPGNFILPVSQNGVPTQRTVPKVPLPKSHTHLPEQISQDGKNVDPSKYKTRMCRNWIQNHYCPYGNVCMYAHGETELRKVNENAQVMESLYKLAQQLMFKQGTEALNHPIRQGGKKKKSRSKRKKAAGETVGQAVPEESTSPGGLDEPSDEGISDEAMVNMLSQLDLSC